MYFQLLQNGFIALVPSLTVLIILSGIGIVLFLAGRATALCHLIKHHLPDIADDEHTKLIAKNRLNEIIIARLREDNKLYVEDLSGMRHLLRKGDIK